MQPVHIEKINSLSLSLHLVTMEHMVRVYGSKGNAFLGEDTRAGVINVA